MTGRPENNYCIPKIYRVSLILKLYSRRQNEKNKYQMVKSFVITTANDQMVRKCQAGMVKKSST